MHQEGAVADLVDLHTVDRAHRRHDLIDVFGVPRRRGHIHLEPLVPRRRDVKAGHQSATSLDRGGELTDSCGAGRQLEPDGDRVGNGGGKSHGLILLITSRYSESGSFRARTVYRRLVLRHTAF